MMINKIYQEISERMVADAFHRGCDLSVLLEDIYDESFWRCIIEHVKPDLRNKIDFPHPNPKGTRGKDILKNFKIYVNRKLIICIDSDCEYLYDNNSWYIDTYIYHTLVHSRENFQCHHISLNEICKDLTGKSYDFQTLLENISVQIAPLFYIWIYLKENKFNDRFRQIINNEIFKGVLNFQGIQFDELGEECNLCHKIEDRVNDILKSLEDAMSEGWYNSVIENDIPDIKNRLIEQYEIHQEEIISFFYGHGVLENFVEPLMIKVMKILKDLSISEVSQELSQASENDMKNMISRIENRAGQDIKTRLNDSFKAIIYAVENKHIQKIKQKIATELVE